MAKTENCNTEVRWKKTLRRPTEAPEETEKKQLLPNMLTYDREIEVPTTANRALGRMSISGAAVAQKDHCQMVAHLRMPTAR